MKFPPLWQYLNTQGLEKRLPFSAKQSCMALSKQNHMFHMDDNGLTWHFLRNRFYPGFFGQASDIYGKNRSPKLFP